MGLFVYLILFTCVAIFEATIGTYYTSFLLNPSINRQTILFQCLVDLLFITTNLKKIKIKKNEASIILFLIFNFIASYFVNKSSVNYSIYRAINDIYFPLILIFKVIIFKSILNDKQSCGLPILFSFGSAHLIVSLFQVTFQFFLSEKTGAYMGSTPPILLPFLNWLQKPNFNILLIFAIIIFSGKRSDAVAYFLISAIFVFSKIKNIRSLSLFFIFGAIAILCINFLVHTPLFEKINITRASVLKLADLDLFSLNILNSNEAYLMSAGRASEIFSILLILNMQNVLFGCGSGTLYTLYTPFDVFDGYSNVHFSFLGLVYKFGIISAILFYYYLVKKAKYLLKSKQKLFKSGGYGLFILIIGSCFSFNLFMTPLLAIFLALKYQDIK